jgi:hypothetical protein
MTAVTASGAQAIGEYLQSPDDLVKISAYRKKLEKEKASIDARLKSGVKEQLHATRDGLRNLLSTRNNVQTIRDEMTTIDAQCMDPQNAVPTFDQISRVGGRPKPVFHLANDRQVSMVHRNFQSTQEMVNNLLEMASKLEVLEKLLESDSSDILGPAPNLLILHFQLNQLESFRNQTMHQAKKASPSSRTTLTRWFERLDRVLAAFDDYILDLARNVLNIVRAGYPHVVVKLVKIAEVEGKEDEKVRPNPRCVKREIFYRVLVGNNHSSREESGEVECRIEIQVNPSQRPCHQALPLKDYQGYRRLNPRKVSSCLPT